jgi:hypothetical protein
MKSPYGTQADKIREMCARPTGCSLKEAAEGIGKPMTTASVYIANMVNGKEAVKAGCHGGYRYFKWPEHAEPYHEKAVIEFAARMEQSKIRRRAYQAKRERVRRINERIAKGMPPYLAPKPPKPPKPPKVAKPKAVKQAPKQRTMNILIETNQQGLDQKREHKAATIVWPEHVKVQVYETRPDMRFKLEPGYRGQFSQEWQERRAA